MSFFYILLMILTYVPVIWICTCTCIHLILLSLVVDTYLLTIHRYLYTCIG